MLSFNPIIQISVGMIFAALLLSQSVRRRFFAWIYSTFLYPKLLAPIVYHEKKKFFRKLESVVSSDPELRKEGAIRILEIGLGSGVNLEFYPPNCRVIGLDINPNFVQYFEKEKKKTSHVHVEKLICGTAENMVDVPDNSVDVVVGTYVLCSIPDREAALAEVRRVLVPGGKYFFFEHVRSRSTLSALVQYLMAPFIDFFFGCKFIRQQLSVIKKAGFSSMEASVVKLPSNILFVMNTTELGIAVK